jgi:hypothetical protein
MNETMINFPGPGLSRQDYLQLLHDGHETGFWNEHGQPAPWPDDIDEWRPQTNKINIEPGQPPF